MKDRLDNGNSFHMWG